MKLFKALSVASCLFFAWGCTAQSVTAPIEGEPVCPDFALGVTKKMHKGSLRRPVRVQVVDDDEVRSERLLLGRRTTDAPGTVVVVKDDDVEYTIRWQQCANEFAPRPINGSDQPGSRAGFNCGEAKTYKEHKLTVREGDSKSRTLTYVAPPNATCWTGVDVSAPSASASAPVASASAPVASASAPVASASAPVASASAPVASASAPVASASAPAGSASAPAGSAAAGSAPVKPSDGATGQ